MFLFRHSLPPKLVFRHSLPPKPTYATLQGLLHESAPEFDFLSVIRDERQKYVSCGDQTVLSFSPQSLPCYSFCQNTHFIGHPLLNTTKPDRFIALIHGLCHIEYNAFKAYLDTLLRFQDQFQGQKQHQFCLDLLQIVEEECTHFYELKAILEKKGVTYGYLGVHSGLRDHTDISRSCLAQRLALLSIFAEGKALDSSVKHLSKMVTDEHALGVITTILEEEVGHVAKGVHWFKQVCSIQDISYRHRYVQILNEHRLRVMPPVNRPLRLQAGFDEEWLDMLTQ